MNRPLLWTTIYFIMGIIGGTWYEYFIPGSLFCVVIGISLVGVGFYWKQVKWPLVFMAIFLLGLIRSHYDSTVTEKNLFVGSEQLLEGKVVVSKKTDYNTEIVLADVKKITKEKSISLRSKVLVKMDLDTEVEKEDRVQVVTRPFATTTQMNPSDMDYEGYLKSEGITVQLKGRLKALEKGTPTSGDKVMKGLENRLELIFKGKDQGILQATLLGNMESIPQTTKTIYFQTGIGHLLSISGFHTGVISMLIITVAGLLTLSYEKRYCWVIGMVWMYTFFTGCDSSMVRASVVISILSVGRLLWEEEDLLISLGIAAFLLLYAHPFLLYQVGFQLSFGGMLALIISSWITERIQEKKEYTKKQQLLIGVFVPWIVLTVLLAPVIAYHFFQVPLLASLLNLLIIPAFTGIIIGGLGLLVVSVVSISVASFFGNIFIWALEGVLVLGRLFLKLPLATLVVPRVGVMGIVCYYIVVAVIVRSFLKGAIKEYVSGVVIGVLILLPVYNHFNNRFLTLDQLYVGQGDSSFIFTPHGKTILMDGGSRGKGKTVEKYLHYKGKRQIDMVFISHLHEDHVGGIIELIEMGVPIKKIFLPNVEMDTEWGNQLLALGKKEKIAFYWIEKGDAIALDGVAIQVLFPTQSVKEVENLNNTSLVLRFTYGAFDALYTGDIEASEDRLLLDSLTDIEVLKVAHHGSLTSSSYNFLLKTKPEYAIISCGINNRYKHPNGEVLGRLEAYTKKVFRTDKEGAIEIKTDGNRIKVSTQIE